MNIVGIVGEYNPFHYGHLYHLLETKKLFDDCAVVCAMSGDFVQRGEAALFDKFVRAEAACRCGVDLVLELPVRWALSSAEGFADGAVQLLNNAGCEYISFGSECGNIKLMEETAELFCGGSFIEEIKEKMRTDKELSFAAARETVLSEYSRELSEIIKTPNNILGVEYIKAIKNREYNIRPLTVKRRGNAHDSYGGEELPSASEIRQRFFQGEQIERFIPAEAWSVYARAIEDGRVQNRELFDMILLSRLRMFGREYYNSLPDTSDGLGNRLFRASRECTALQEMYNITKTKKYAMSRVRRACMCACIGITKDSASDALPYIRVLAANKKGRFVLKKITEEKCVPVITKPTSVKKYDKKYQKMFADGVSANDLYVLGVSNKSVAYGGQDWTKSPIIVEDA
ncbi:MAG: nucleotidyltransferase family protein [Eubacteriales bacterium]|nr:nucleotidyltransferase family protein [Eubacteriales bacterium]